MGAGFGVRDRAIGDGVSIHCFQYRGIYTDDGAGCCCADEYQHHARCQAHAVGAQRADHCTFHIDRRHH